MLTLLVAKGATKRRSGREHVRRIYPKSRAYGTTQDPRINDLVVDVSLRSALMDIQRLFCVALVPASFKI